MLDLLLRNALVFDGTGAPARKTPLGVTGGRITFPGRDDAPARETLDLEGRWVTPGFLDIHTHYDIEAELDPLLPESLRHGVTAVVMGNCSLSATFGDPAVLADIFQRVETIPAGLLRRWLAAARERGGQGGSDAGAAAYLERLARRGPGPAVAPMLGHSALRAHVMGLERSLREDATGADLARMEALARESLQAGCIGISVDMVPWHRMSGEFRGMTVPSQRAGYREYAMLARVCREFDAVFQATPNPRRAASLLDLLRLAVPRKGRPLRMTVLTALDFRGKPHLWRFFPAFAFLANRVLGGNLRFQTLAEPFRILSDGPLTPLFEEFPSGVRLNDRDTAAERRALWREDGFRKAFRRDFTARRGASWHRDLDAMTVVRAPEAGWAGRTLGGLARAAKREPLEFFLDALENMDTALRWETVGGNHRPDIRRKLLRHPHILPGFTDAGAHLRNLGFYDGALSLLREAVQGGAMSPERAVHRSTGEPAAWFRLDCGVLEEGARADFTILRPEALRLPVPAPVERPDPLLAGESRVVKAPDPAVEAVYVGGACLCRDGAVLRGAEPGRVLVLSGPRFPEAAEHRSRRNRLRRGMAAPVWLASMTYWDIFLLKHRRPRNVAVHAAAAVYLYAVAAWAFSAGNPWLLLLMPLSQMAGILSHKLFEDTPIDSRDAVFSWRATWSLNRMLWELARGRYWKEVARAEARLAEAEAEAAEGAARSARAAGTSRVPQSAKEAAL